MDTQVGVGVLYLKYVKGYKFESIFYVTQLRCAEHRAERRALEAYCRFPWQRRGFCTVPDRGP